MRNICAYDGKAFEATRADARYCSAVCRARASRERRKRLDPPESVSAGEAGAHPVRSDALAERVERVEERLAGLQDDVDLIELRTDALPADQQLLELVQREVAAAMAPVLRRLQAVEGLGARLRAAGGATVRERRAALADDARVDELEQAVITLAHRVAGLREDIERFAERIAALGDDVRS